MGVTIDKASISFRVGTTLWMPEKRFQELLDLFDRYRGVTDEVTFFTAGTHPPLPLAAIEERAAILARRMPEARRRGYRAGINILATIGHHNENLPDSLSGDYTRLTDIDGNVCLGGFCPNDERMRHYIRELYRLIVNVGPDYLWIDDDVRLLGHMPLRATCFCDNCLSVFAGESGTSYTRESLNEAFNNGSLPEKLSLRKAWLRHNRDTMARLFALVEETVHAIRPNLPLGFMTGDRFFEGYDFDTWAGILAGDGEVEVRWRPGGGFYDDEAMSGLAGKSHDTGRQVSILPDGIRCIQSEIENFPYQRLKKSAHTTVLEAAAHMAAGCTGAAFNVLSMVDEPLDEYEPLVARLRQARPFYDLLARAFGRCHPVGVHTGWGKDTFAANNAREGDWLGGGGWNPAGEHAREIFEIGIPVAYSPARACAAVLAGDGVLAMNEEEILRLLSGGVYLDSQALSNLNDLGYGDLTGFAVEGYKSEDCIEEFLEHPLNAGFAGRRRDGRQSFWKNQAAMLRPLADGARPLSRMVDYGDREVSRCCMGVFENRLGGRICAAGYCPWTFLQNLSKSSQIKSVISWLSRETLPALVSSFHKVNLWAREPETGRIAAALINASLDPAVGLALLLRTEHETIRVTDMACAEVAVAAAGREGPYRRFVLPEVDPWQMRLVETG